VHKTNIAYTSRLIPTKSIELIEMKQVLQTSQQKHMNNILHKVLWFKGFWLFELSLYTMAGFCNSPKLIIATNGKMFNVKNI
jgi:hypothetical protein